MPTDTRSANDPPSKPEALVFTIGLNGYARRWEPCVATQRAYAAAHGYDYCVVDELSFRLEPRESSWLKIPLISAAMTKGYSWVFFVDADCEIKPGMPDASSLSVAGKCVYAARGHSGRINAGVLIARRSEQSVRAFREILDRCDRPVADPADRAPYENGHVIERLKGEDYVEVLDSRYNNTSDPSLEDYIRHYTGPMREHAPGQEPAAPNRDANPSASQRPLRRLLGRAKRALTGLMPAKRATPIGQRLQKAAAEICERRPQHFAQAEPTA